MRAAVLLALASPLLTASLRVAPSPLGFTAATPRTCRRTAVIVAADEEPDPKAEIKQATEKMKKTISSVQENLSTLRVGRATPSLLDRVEVNYYDTPTPLNQLASVVAATASQLVVDVYDKSCLGDVEKALYESDLGMTPSNDGKVIRLNVPALTTERRAELSKTAKSLGEEGKVAIRNIRKSALDKIKKMKKAIGDDAAKDAEEEVQKVVKKFESDVVELVTQRENEIMGN